MIKVYKDLRVPKVTQVLQEVKVQGDTLVHREVKVIGVILVLREAEVIGAILEAKDLEDMVVKKEKRENCNAAIVTSKNTATVFLTKSGC